MQPNAHTCCTDSQFVVVSLSQYFRIGCLQLSNTKRDEVWDWDPLGEKMHQNVLHEQNQKK